MRTGPAPEHCVGHRATVSSCTYDQQRSLVVRTPCATCCVRRVGGGVSGMQQAAAGLHPLGLTDGKHCMCLKAGYLSTRLLLKR
jgi:hypothetical protein